MDNNQTSTIYPNVENTHPEILTKQRDLFLVKHALIASGAADLYEEFNEAEIKQMMYQRFPDRFLNKMADVPDENGDIGREMAEFWEYEEGKGEWDFYHAPSIEMEDIMAALEHHKEAWRSLTI